jgi:hypothetical protein
MQTTTLNNILVFKGFYSFRGFRTDRTGFSLANFWKKQKRKVEKRALESLRKYLV